MFFYYVFVFLNTLEIFFYEKFYVCSVKDITPTLKSDNPIFDLEPSIK